MTKGKKTIDQLYKEAEKRIRDELNKKFDIPPDSIFYNMPVIVPPEEYLKIEEYYVPSFEEMKEMAEENKKH